MSKLAEKMNRSWRLLTSSFQIIAQHKKLLLFPLVSLLFNLVVILFFVFPAALLVVGLPGEHLEHWKAVGKSLGLSKNEPGNPSLETAAYVYLAGIYLLSMFCATFCNVAFYNEILKALAGEAVSIREGLRFACRRLRAILAWSLFAGVVGLIIQSLERRFGLFGRIMLRFIGVAWSVASVFVIPVIIREENANPVALLRDSAATLKKTWGESLIGYVGITLGSWLVLLLMLIIVPVIILLTALDLSGLIIPVGILWLLGFIATLYVIGTASHVFRCALYVYASEGVVPAPYTAELMDAAWKVKKS